MFKSFISYQKCSALHRLFLSMEYIHEVHSILLRSDGVLQEMDTTCSVQYNNRPALLYFSSVIL